MTADYIGRADVVNRCRTEDGDLESSEAVARRPDPDRPGALEVRRTPQEEGP